MIEVLTAMSVVMLLVSLLHFITTKLKVMHVDELVKRGINVERAVIVVYKR